MSPNQSQLPHNRLRRMHACMYTHTDRQTETDRDRQRQTETDRDRQRQTETDRETETDRDRQTDRDTDRQTYRHTDIQTYIHTYMYTCIIYMSDHIHIYIYIIFIFIFKGCRPCRRPRKRMWRSRGRSTTSILFFGGCRKQRIMQRHWIAQGGRHCSVKSDKNRSWGRFTSEMMMMTWFFQCKLWRKTHPAGRNNAKIEPQNSLTSLLKP